MDISRCVGRIPYPNRWAITAHRYLSPCRASTAVCRCSSVPRIPRPLDRNPFPRSVRALGNEHTRIYLLHTIRLDKW